jgi:hypothetical protein
MNPIRLHSTFLFLFLAMTACGANDLASVGTDRSGVSTNDPPDTAGCTDTTSSCSPQNPKPDPTPMTCTLACTSGTHLRADACVCDPDAPTSILPKTCPLLDTDTEIDPQKPVLIKTADDLLALTDAKLAYYKLANDIDMSGVAFKPLRIAEAIFDGGGHTISNVSITGTGQVGYGLFDNTSCAIIRDLTLASFTIDVSAPGGPAGIVTGRALDTSFERVTVTGAHIAGAAAPAGGIAGLGLGAVGIGKVTADVAIDLPGSVGCTGGFVGSSSGYGAASSAFEASVTVRQSTFKGSINAGSCLGGAVAAVEGRGNAMAHSFATLEISDTTMSGNLSQSSGSGRFGGLVGDNLLSKTTIKTSHVSGSLVGSAPGGIIGHSFQPEPETVPVLVSNTWPAALPEIAATDTSW